MAGLELRDELEDFKSMSRKIGKMPAKVLEAPSLQDDFYLNLIDWSPQTLIAVGLSTNVYLWNTRSSQSLKLCDLGFRNYTTSVKYSSQEPHLAVGTSSGIVQLWDIEKTRRVRALGGHCERVGSMAWSKNLLTTGSRDKSILQRDIRCPEPYTVRLSAHTEEVCGLNWSPDDQQLCSGGNDNRVLVWSKHSDEPQIAFEDHVAAVKAVAWSPHQHGLLASGGGTIDRTIKFRNTLTGETMGSWETGSQVCNLAFSRTLNELVSTHGYSQN
jgi:cell division cycle 20-like protein 1, cofactor of APC complex